MPRPEVMEDLVPQPELEPSHTPEDWLATLLPEILIFPTVPELSAEHRGPEVQEALEAMAHFLSANNGSGVQAAIDYAVYKKLGGIIVYPVEDEHRYCNNKGEVLPDAHIVPRGTTALELAAKVHTDLAHKFIGAIDAKKRIRVGADHRLEDGDVIKIIAGR